MATSIDELKNAKQTWEFKAPDFPNGSELIVELKQPSIMSMIKDGVISNPLIADVQTLTEKTDKGVKPTAAQQTAAYKFIKGVVDYCIVSPTIAEIDKYAGGLTDSQILAIYGEVMKSVTDLSSFRTDTTDT